MLIVITPVAVPLLEYRYDQANGNVTVTINIIVVDVFAGGSS